MQTPLAITLTVGSDGGPLPVRDLSDYLLLLRAEYALCVNAGLKASQPYDLKLRSTQLEYAEDDIERYADLVQSIETSERGPHRVSGYSAHWLGRSNLPPDVDLVFYGLSRQNPIEMILGGVAIALGAAVILSGGELKITKDGIHCKVRSLGQGIADLKKALSSGQQKPRLPRRKRNSEIDSDA